MNLLLRALCPSDLSLIGPYLVRTPLSPGARISTAGVPIDKLLFPDSATITLSSARPYEDCVAVALVGREGMIGWSTLLGHSQAPFDAAVGPVSGSGRMIDPAPFAAACAASVTLRTTILRFAQAMTDQLTSSVASAIHDGVGRRLARWLLMLHDRQDGDELALTHDTLAMDLGTRRASVTDYLHLLEGDHVVRCARGRIIVRDRGALERVAGAAYGSAEARYRALIGPFGRGGEARSSRARAA